MAKHIPPAALDGGLPESSIPALLKAAAIGAAPTFEGVPGMTESIREIATEALLDARVSAYHYIYYSTIAINGLGVIAALLLRDYDHLFNSHVPRQMYTGGKGAAGGLPTEKQDLETQSKDDNGNEVNHLEENLSHEIKN